MPVQHFPVQYTGQPSKELETCSAPVKGYNLGCRAWGVCTQKTKGKHPVRVFFIDRIKKMRDACHCVDYEYRLKQHPEIIERTPRPTTWKRVIRTMQFPDNPPGRQGHARTEVIELEPPPEAMLGMEGYRIEGVMTGKLHTDSGVNLLEEEPVIESEETLEMSYAGPPRTEEPESIPIPGMEPGEASFETDFERKAPVTVDVGQLRAARRGR